jgi:alpha-D-glucose phosphate-specific phosphoglucomutase
MIKFGTDGWRAVIAEDFTFDNVRACAQGVAEYLKQKGLVDKKLVIGNDTRFASDEFAAACAEVLAGNGIKVLLCPQPAPTPVISYTVKNTGATGAIIITASHNPGSWNGFKYKDETGASAPTEIVDEIEKKVNEVLLKGQINRKKLEDCINSGLVEMYDPVPEYNTQVRRLVDVDRIKQQKLKVVYDAMYGAGIGYFDHVIGGGKLHIHHMNGERNPLFPGMLQPEPIARNLTRLCSVVKDEKANVGLATDGDADRIGIVSEKGDYLDTLYVFALLAMYFIEVHNERRPIIRSLCATSMLDKIGKIYNIPVYITKVGFKYVAPMMLEKDAFIGGEESGGYGFRNHVPERDGILAGIYFLDYMIQTGKTPSQLLEHLFSIVGPHYYDRIDVHITPELHQKAAGNMAKIKVDSVAGRKVARLETADGYKFILDDDSWLLIRFSGTEPLIRIYSEASSPQRVQDILQVGKELVGI